MPIPKYAGKVSAKDIQSMPFKYFNEEKLADTPCQYSLSENGLQYDFLWSPKNKGGKLFVLFSGDILREKNEPPVYQRWSWAPSFPGNCLYISDPSLNMSNNLGLAWYVGNNELDPMHGIANIVKKVCVLYNIDYKDVVSYGSSGGGFAAIRFLLFFEEATAVAINPQTNIEKYHKSKVRDFLRELFSNESPENVFFEHSDRTNLLKLCESLKDKNIIYAQNLQDSFHIENHKIPFFDEIKRVGGGQRLHEIIFEDEGGHGKAENEYVFNKIIDMLSFN
ncbi:hypothetical protein ACT3UM_06745 [Halomonas sp. AOP13-D3-9]